MVGVMIEDASRIAAFVERAATATARRRRSPRSCARCARSACAATSTRTSCEFVDELPRTLTGKVQRFKLRTLAAEGSER